MLKTRQARLGAAAVLAVALVAAGAAFAAGRMHLSASSSVRGGGFGPPPAGGKGGYGRGFFPGGMRPDGFRGPGGGGFVDLYAAAAAYLGVTEDALRSSLSSGKTLAQIANGTSGKTASGLVDALVAAQKAQLDQAVKDGRLSQAQADRLSSFLTDRVQRLVDGTGFGFRGGHGDRDGGGRFWPPGGGEGGPPPAPTTTAPATHI